MKLSEQTISILKNFSVINSNLYFKTGNVLSTISEESHIFAQAEVAETFAQDFAIFDLHKFLGALDLFQNPELDCGEKSIEMVRGDESLTYVYADPSTIVYPKKSKIDLPAPKIDFTLTDVQMSSVVKTASALQLPDLSIVGDGNAISLKIHDKKNSSSNAYKVKLDVKTAEQFDLRFKIGNLKFIPGAYKVQISFRNKMAVGYFENTVTKVKYWVSSESDSKFSESLAE